LESHATRELRKVTVKGDVEEEADIRKRIAQIMEDYSGANAREGRGQAFHKFESDETFSRPL